jgi:hypothetical protein
MKKAVSLIITLALILVLVSCSGSKIKMSISEVGDFVVYNRSMVGVDDLIGNNIKTVVDFKDADAKKMSYITNTLNYGSTSASINIVNGRYYEAYSEQEGKKICRGILVFLEMEDAQKAEAAINQIKKDLNSERSSDGVYNLSLVDAVQNKNDIFIYYLRDVQAEFELKRVFTSKDVK